jgi:hypothetical protein
VIFIPLTVVRVSVVLKEPFLGWRSNYEGLLESSWTDDGAPLLYRARHNSRQSTNFSNGPRMSFKIYNDSLKQLWERSCKAHRKQFAMKYPGDVLTFVMLRCEGLIKLCFLVPRL